MTVQETLAQLNGTIQKLAEGNSVSKIAGTQPPAAPGVTDPAEDPAQFIQSKGIRGDRIDEAFVDPMRKNFESLAKASPSHFAALGSTKVLDDPYSYVREKDANGTYRVSNAQLDLMIRGLMAVNDTRAKAVEGGASDFAEFSEKSGNPTGSIQECLFNAAQHKQFGENSDMIMKVLDTSAAAPLIRTDIEPLLREAYLRYFPAYDMISKIPSNGLRHTWNLKTAPGTADFVSELGSLAATESNSTYSQPTSTNIAVIAAQRSISLKAQYASTQSGMNFNLAGSGNTEVVSAMQAIANKVQATIFQGNESVVSKTADDEDGATNALGFTGLRQQLKGGAYSITKASETFLQIIRKGVAQLYDGGADLNSILMFLSVGAQSAVDSELQQYLRILKSEDGGPTPANLGSTGLAMLAGILARPQMVPAQGTQTNGVGYYTYSAAATEDIYLLDPNGIALPYLGSPNPTLLQLPLGYNDKLANVFIPFTMIGLSIYIKNFNRKIRIPKQAI